MMDGDDRRAAVRMPQVEVTPFWRIDSNPNRCNTRTSSRGLRTGSLLTPGR